jgi:16S rRNA processing protein RimM
VKNKRPQLYAVGSVVKAFGIRGEIVVQHMTDSADRFRSLRSVWMGADSQSAAEVRIEHVAVESRGVRVKLRGIDDRTAAESLHGKVLFVDEKHLVPLPAGRYFVHDVIGLTVRDEQGHELGSVADVLRYPANDIYVVRGNGNEFMIPAVREFVAAIDLAHRTMTVHLIEGLVE